ncbi:MAG TPA: RNA polymerase factor sigma-54 [Ktedonobacterales bacterium]|nr:RNA polymerase factor sigma-54 [Ktedonobacterales bacterium]
MMDVIDMRLDATVLPQQSTVISHRQIVAVRLLQMPSQELSAAIARERDANPAFEADERESCHYCGAGVDAGRTTCPACGMSNSGAERAADAAADASADSTVAANRCDDDSDPMLRVASAESRGEGLLLLLCASLSEDDAPVAEYLVGSLDHHGYLPLTIVDDVADALTRSQADVERILRVLQRMDPPGIGARGARECLLIQLERLRETRQAKPLAERLVRDHLAELAFRHFREVARAVGETPRAVEAEWQFIREHLHPYPSHGFDPDFGEIAEAAPPVRPDVVIRPRGASFEADVVERQRYDLRVNHEYLWARKHLGELGCGEGDRQHIRGYVEQAHSFIAALRQRWDTMQRVSDALIELQCAFLRHGQSALQPLTRADVAKRVQLHESTVSRATDGKYVLLPTGRTVPFDDFFDSSLPVKTELRELIATENARRPFSDEQLARLLAKRGFNIARRTIAKYREEEGILPSRLRRSRPTVERTANVLVASLAR